MTVRCFQGYLNWIVPPQSQTLTEQRLNIGFNRLTHKREVTSYNGLRNSPIVTFMFVYAFLSFSCSVKCFQYSVTRLTWELYHGINDSHITSAETYCVGRTRSLQKDVDELGRHQPLLEKHVLYATGTTGNLIQRATGMDVNAMLSGPMGGDQQVGA
jgi:hypothetical protein